MSQDFNTSSNKPRRVPRSQRNRPVLVTSTTDEQAQQPVQETLTPSVEPVTLVEPPPAPRRRLPGFFSTVGKSELGTVPKPKETDIAQARLARATRGKTATKTEKTAAVKESPAEKPAKAAASKTGTTPARPTPQRPPSLFKPRYIIGMIVYLVAANFLGVYERNILMSMGAERVLTKLNLFGLPIVISTSGLVFIATLIIILVLLAKLDFLPTSLAAASGAQSARKGAAPKNADNRDSEGVRNIPPPIKQGVQGSHDELYRSYRTNQRRGKKR
jgi:hypothetical protein